LWCKTKTEKKSVYLQHVYIAGCVYGTDVHNQN
jgi:hypothetical protein